MHAVGVQLERGLDVVVDDERDAELTEATPALHDLLGAGLDPQLHDRRPDRDGPAGAFQVSHDRVHLHRVRALPSSVAGSSAASASYRPTWNEPGPFASRAASSPATPSATSASAAASS